MEAQKIRKLLLFEKLSDEQLDWLSVNSTEVTYPAHERLIQEGEPAVALFSLITGEWRLTRQLAGHDTTLIETAQPGSWIGGIPLVDGIYQSSAQTTKESCFLRIPNDAVRYMLNNGFPIASHIINGISVGARNVEAILQQHEKMAALGKLSAGLAHELNNPAAANRRSAAQLRDTLQTIQSQALQLNQYLTPAQLEQLAALQKDALDRAKQPPSLDSITQNEQEDAINIWLDDHRVEEGWQIAPTLVESGLDVAWLDRLSEQVGANALGSVLSWLEAALAGVSLLNQIEQSSERISKLVKAVKEYSYMDQAPQQEIDIHDGLESTLTILAYKLKQGIEVTREYDRKLPHINAYGSELNQVWTNLLDNAIDAMHGQGHIWVRTRREDDLLVVEIADNGPGVPKELQTRIFEPFFTTKGVGEGSGLGLDVAYRIVVNRHKGELKLVSEPGDTRFLVKLPLDLK